MDLYIMRHGETEWNRLGKLQGSVDVPLNEFGIELAERTRDGFQEEGIVFDKAFTSPYVRAGKTAEIILEGSGVAAVVDENIREFSFGEYEGVLVRELRTNPAYARFSKCFDDPIHYEPEADAESYGQVFDRAERFLKEQILPLEGQCDNVLVVCHGGILRALACIIRKLPLQEFWTLRQPNCSVNLAKVSGGKITMVEENRLYYEFREDASRGFV